MKTKYNITYHGATGKVETAEIEATDVSMIDGTDGNCLVCWKRAKRTVFALPYRFLIQTSVVDELKMVKIRHLKHA